jgi:hypothetical protein
MGLPDLPDPARLPFRRLHRRGLLGRSTAVPDRPGDSLTAHGPRTVRNSRTHAVLILAIGALALSIGGCAGTLVRSSLATPSPAQDALLILPGFGYGRSGEAALRALAAPMSAEHIDLFVPSYISRAGLAQSRTKLQRFIRDHHLERYARLHVFAFLAGAWTLNPLADTQAPANLTTVIYDRSPYQERAPRIADEALHLRAWLRFGSPIFDVARTPYPPLAAPRVKVGIVVETLPTTFIKQHAERARRYGPFAFRCDAFGQRHEDCIYLPLNHDDLYRQFAAVWPEVRAFIREGRFTTAANRSPPSGDALAIPRAR